MSLHPCVFARLVYQPDGCLTYNGSLDRGYGKARVRIDGRETTLRVHRYVYEQLVGQVSEGLQLDHLCRNRACCNPMHLEPVTQHVNASRAAVHRIGVPHPRRSAAVCGTTGGANLHWRNGEPICDPCRAARAAAERQQSAAYRGTAA